MREVGRIAGAWVTRWRIAAGTLLSTAILLLAACGGGGGGGGETFSVRGVVTASSAAAADSDVNDPDAPFASNDTCNNAQPLANTVTLGGYLNAPGAGPAGRSRAAGDLVDLYRVELLAGQTASLYMSESPLDNDLDLFLFDADCETLVDASMDVDVLEVVTAPADGEYFLAVVVFCTDGACPPTATTYNLVIGNVAIASLGRISAGADFVPGEAIVRFRETGTLASDGAAAVLQAPGIEAKAGATDRAMLLRVDGEVATLQSLGAKRPSDALAALAPLGVTASPELRAKLETIAAVRALRGRPEVALAEPNYLRRTFLEPNDEGYVFQWHYPQIGLPAAWDISLGEDVIVAVIDTGVCLDHPDLQGQLVAGYDFILDPASALDGDGPDADPNDPGDGAGAGGRSSFHGTHVAGTIAAATDNGIGVAGVAGAARIMPLRALGRRGGTDFDIAEAMRFAAGLPNGSGTVPPQRADIINLSLGGTQQSSFLAEVVQQVRDAGVIIVAAAGNSGNDTPHYPASYDGVFSVGAVDISKTRAPYSSFGADVDLAGPGGNVQRDINGDGYADGVLSTSADDGEESMRFVYAFQNGTSMAAPHVAGVFALMKAVNPAMTPDDLDGLLAAGDITEDLGAPGRDDQFGWGLIDAYRAVLAAGAVGSGAALLQVSPRSLNFSSDLTELPLRLRNLGAEALVASAPQVDEPWLSVTPQSVDDDGLGTYRVMVDRSALEVGAYRAIITIDADTGTVEVPVNVQVAAAGAGFADAGFHWFILVDPETLDTVQTVNAAVDDGTYRYRFTRVPPGDYLIFAGTDLDNDTFICADGEACGGYPTVSRLEIVKVDGNRNDVNFVSSYLTGFGTAAAASAGGRPKQVDRMPGLTLPPQGLSRVPRDGKRVGAMP